MANYRTERLAEDDVVSFSKGREEPDWLTRLRLTAWRAYEELPMLHLERTTLRESMFEGLALPVPAARAASWDDVPEDVRQGIGHEAAPANGVVLANGYVQFSALDAEWAEKGVIFQSLAEAAKQHGDIVEKYLAKEAVPADGDKPWALNAALWSDGAFLYVPEGVEVTVPFHVSVWSNGELGLFDRVLVVAAPNSRVTVVEEVSSPEGDGPALRTGVVEVYADAGAQVKYCSLQTLGEEGKNLTIRRAVVGNDASVQWVVGEFGSSFSVSLSESYLEGRGGESTNVTVFFAGGKQHIDVEPRMYHVGTHTESNITVKGVNRDEGRSVYAPITDMEDEADEAAAFQKGTVLLLDPSTRTYCIPQLYVAEEAVAGAGHAATVGQVDEEQLFYLRSRGLSEKEALKLLVFGFFHPAIDMVPIPEVRQRLEQLIDRKMEP